MNNKKARTAERFAPATQHGNTNLIGSDQWNISWAAAAPPIRLRAWRDYVSWRLSRLFREYIKAGHRILEVGCGGSAFLPYFAKDLGAEVWGLDFSPAGVVNAKAALTRAGVSGTIIQGDLFTFKEIPFGTFDVVFSAGFIEHFTDTADVLKRIIRFAKPRSGLIITTVPNMGGAIGAVHKRLARDFYAQHVALTPELLDSIHCQAGATPVQRAEYFGSICLGVVNYEQALRRLPRLLITMARRTLEIPQFLITLPLWALRTKIETASFSPYIVGVYRRTGT